MFSKQVTSEKEQNILTPSSYQSSTSEFIYIDNKESYACTNCSSNIEIISIDHIKSKIVFKCTNNNCKNNHKIQTLPINEYLKNMKKNTYLFDKCSICYKEQSSIKNFFLLKYCVNCEVIICNECKEKHINNNRDQHFLINNNERRIKCLLHPKNNNVEYCRKCEMHLCNECLETRKHLEHDTISLRQVKASIKEKKLLEANIESLKNKKNKMEKENIDKINQYNNNLNEIREKMKCEYENKIKSDEIEENRELKNNDIKKKEELEEIQRKYENAIKNINDKYNINVNKIKEKYKKIKDEYKKKYNEKIVTIANNFDIDELNKKMNNLEDLISIYEIIKTTQEKYTDNYHNNMNLINAISFFEKNKNRIDIPEKSNIENEKHHYYKSEEININRNTQGQSLIINQINNNKDNFFLSKKLKYENKALSNELEILKNKYKKLEKENQSLKEKNSEINRNDSKKMLLKQKSEINGDDTNSKNISKNNLSEPSNSSISNKIVFESYCPTDIDNSFVVFISANNKNPYIVYSDMRKSIFCYNLMNNKIEQVKKNAHIEPISSFRYLYNNNTNTNTINEYILSLSYKNNQIKIWNFKTWEEKLKLNKIYQEGFIYSSCFLKDKSYINFLTSNWIKSKTAYSIRVYNLRGEMIKEVNDSNDNVLFMDTYYDKDKYINYIIISCRGYIKTYNYNKNQLYFKYQDKNNYNNIYSFIIYEDNNNILKIIESSENGTIRLWNFHSGTLYYKFDVETNWIGGICLYNKDNLLVGCGDKTIKLISIKEGIVKQTITGHNGKICCIKKINIPNYGKCFFSLGKDNKLIKWKDLFLSK